MYSYRYYLEKAPPSLQENFIEAFSQLRDWEQIIILSSLHRLVEMMKAKKVDLTETDFNNLLICN